MPQIPDLQDKTNAAANDRLVIRDTSSNTDKDTSVAGLAPAIATSFAVGGIDASKIDFSTMPLIRVKYNNGTSTGGQVIAGSAINTLVFDTITKNVGGFSHSAGIVTVPAAGAYSMSLNLDMVDAVSGSYTTIFSYSTDSGSTWTSTGGRRITGAAGGLSGIRDYAEFVDLPVNARVRVDFRPDSATRVGGNSFDHGLVVRRIG